MPKTTTSKAAKASALLAENSLITLKDGVG
jgi:hypothetical protein